MLVCLLATVLCFINDLHNGQNSEETKRNERENSGRQKHLVSIATLIGNHPENNILHHHTHSIFYSLNKNPYHNEGDCTRDNANRKGENDGGNHRKSREPDKGFSDINVFDSVVDAEDLCNYKTTKRQCTGSRTFRTMPMIQMNQRKTLNVFPQQDLSYV